MLFGLRGATYEDKLVELGMTTMEERCGHSAGVQNTDRERQSAEGVLF
jgi:hypothetical protein